MGRITGICRRGRCGGGAASVPRGKNQAAACRLSCRRYRKLSRDRNFNITAWRGGIDGLCHACNRTLNARPTGGGQHNNCDFAAHGVLLISEILVSRDQNGKAVLFGHLQQFTIFQIVPAKFKGRGDLMGCEVFAKRDRSTLVEKNAHLSRFERAGGVLKYCTDLRERDAREPGNKVRDLGPIFEVLE